MLPFQCYGLLIRSIIQAILLVLVLDAMGAISGNMLTYFVLSVFLFVLRLIVTNYAMKKDVHEFFVNSNSYSKEKLSTENFYKKYALLDPEMKVYHRKKNPLYYIVSYNESFGIIASKNEHDIEINSIRNYYL